MLRAFDTYWVFLQPVVETVIIGGPTFVDRIEPKSGKIYGEFKDE